MGTLNMLGLAKRVQVQIFKKTKHLSSILIGSYGQKILAY